MSYAQDTIVSPNAADVFAGVLDGLLTHAGWTVVESLNPSSTYQVKVYKSAGTSNECGYDWYTVLKWNAIGTEQNVEIMNGGAYDAGTHTLSEIAGTLQGTGNSPHYSEAITGAHISAQGVNSPTDTSVSFSSHSAGLTKPWFATIVPSSAFGYWMSVTLDHLSVYTTIGGAGGVNPAIYLASSLALDADYAALDFVNLRPVVCYSSSNTNGNAGISASMFGQGTSNFDYVNPTVSYTKPVGTPLPALDGNYLPAYGWREAWYLASAAGAGGDTRIWDSPQFGDGFHIGDGIDYYMVNGGSLGDTVEIEGATYVLSGIMAQIGNTFLAVPVE